MGVFWAQSDLDLLAAAVRADPRQSMRALYEALPDEMRRSYSFDAVRLCVQRTWPGGQAARLAWAAQQRYDDATARERPDLLTVESDKREASFDWREWNAWIRDGQRLAAKASPAQEQTTYGLPDATAPICIVGLCDTHIGDFATDHDLFERLTDELVSTPGLYAVLLGDLAQMAIKLRSVAEVMSNRLTPTEQMQYLDAWMAEVAPKVIAATWDNHAAEREEKASGISMFRHIMSKYVPYSDGIMHLDVRVGQQVYGFALSHRFRGRSMYNRTHGGQRYLRMEAPDDREIVMAGDSHEPGHSWHMERGKDVYALNGGSIQASGYMKRYFSLLNHPHYPCVVLWPDEHRIVPFRCVGDWLALRGT